MAQPVPSVAVCKELTKTWSPHLHWTAARQFQYDCFQPGSPKLHLALDKPFPHSWIGLWLDPATQEPGPVLVHGASLAEAHPSMLYWGIWRQGSSGSVNCHCSSTTKFMDPWGDPPARLHGFVGWNWLWIWPLGQGLVEYLCPILVWMLSQGSSPVSKKWASLPCLSCHLPWEKNVNASNFHRIATALYTDALFIMPLLVLN